jgi:cytochrome c biogenesis protein CcdA
MSVTQAFLLGIMTTLTPCVIVAAICLRRSVLDDSE